jgi:hypothetical protein
MSTQEHSDNAANTKPEMSSQQSAKKPIQQTITNSTTTEQHTTTNTQMHNTAHQYQQHNTHHNNQQNMVTSSATRKKRAHFSQSGNNEETPRQPGQKQETKTFRQYVLQIKLEDKLTNAVVQAERGHNQGTGQQPPRFTTTKPEPKCNRTAKKSRNMRVAQKENDNTFQQCALKLTKQGNDNNYKAIQTCCNHRDKQPRPQPRDTARTYTKMTKNVNETRSKTTQM